jgi:hypothetical protein
LCWVVSGNIFICRFAAFGAYTTHYINQLNDSNEFDAMQCNAGESECVKFGLGENNR